MDGSPLPLGIHLTALPELFLKFLSQVGPRVRKKFFSNSDLANKKSCEKMMKYHVDAKFQGKPDFRIFIAVSPLCHVEIAVGRRTCGKFSAFCSEIDSI